MNGYTILLQAFDGDDCEVEPPGNVQFEWLDKCLIAAEALLQASEDGIERAVVMEWEPDPKFQGGSVSKRQWILEYDDEPTLRVKENREGKETWWASVGALMASLEGVHV
jgi:hypothetical protein